MNAGGGSGDLVFVGDVHLDRDDRELGAFLAFLDRLGESSRRVVFMGDLFNLWLGRRELEQPHQTAVIERLSRMRRRGVSVRYVEGNRDYRIGACYAGGPLDDATDRPIVEIFGGRRLVAVHGDLANPQDRSYRRWRRLSRLGLVWGLFNLMPRERRLRWATRMERRLRSSNPEFKGGFPEAGVRAYAARLLDDEDDALVLGHFHVERDLAPPPHRVLVLPEWKGSRRHLRVTTEGELGFVDSG